MDLVRVLFLMPSKVKGEDVLNIETASLYDDSHEISIVESGDKSYFVFRRFCKLTKSKYKRKV